MFNEASKAHAVWKKHAIETRKTYGFLALDRLKPQIATEMSAAQLKDSVVRTMRLQKSWLSENMKPIESSIFSEFSREHTHFVSEEFVFSVTPECRVEAFSLRDGKKFISSYRPEPGWTSVHSRSGFTLWNSSLYFTETLYYCDGGNR